MNISNLREIAAGILMAFTPLAMANSIVLTQNSYSYSVSGEFSAATTGNFAANYAPDAVLGGGFETFCVETTVDFSPGQTYSYTLSDQDSQGRALSTGAAYLYYEFATGQLPGYNYTDPAARQADAGELQAAIWAFQGNQSYGGFPALNTDPYYALAINALGPENASLPSNGAYDVDVLELWDANQNAAQNQLVYTDVDDSGWACGMLALAGAGLIIFQKQLGRCQLVTISEKRGS